MAQMSSGFLTKSATDTSHRQKLLLCIINEPLFACAPASPAPAFVCVQVCTQMPAREHEHDDGAWVGAPLLALDSPMLPSVAVAIDQQQKQPLKPGLVAETISPLAPTPPPALGRQHQQNQNQHHLHEPSLLSSPTSTSRPQGPPQPPSSASPSMPFSRPPSPAPSMLYYPTAAESAAAATASDAAAAHREAAILESLEWTFKPDRGIIHPATCSICGPYMDHATTASYDPAQPSYERARANEHRAKQAIFWDGVKEGRRRERLELEVAAARYRKERDAAYAEIKRLRIELERLGGGSRAESRTVIDDSAGRGKFQNGRTESQKSAASTDTGLKTLATLASSSSSSALPEIYFSDSSASTNGILSPTRSNQWAHAQPFVPRSTQPGLAQLWDTLGPNETHGTSTSLLQVAEDTQSTSLATNQLAYSPWSPRGEETQLLNLWGKKSESTDSNPLSSRDFLSPPSDQQPRLEVITPIGHGRPLPPPSGVSQQEQQQQQQSKQAQEPPSRIFSPQLTSEVLPSATVTYSHSMSTTTDANTASNGSASADAGWTTVSRTPTAAITADNAEHDPPPPPGVSNPPHRVVMPRTEQALQALLDRAHVSGNHAALARVKALCATAHATPRDQKTPLQRYILANWRNPTWGGQTTTVASPTATSTTPVPAAATRAAAPSFLASWATLAAASSRNANNPASSSGNNNNNRTAQQQQPMNNPRLDDPIEAWAIYLTRHTSSWPRGVRRMPDGTPHMRDLTASRIVSRLRPALATPGHHADGTGATAAMMRAKFTSVCIEVFARKHAYAETLARTGLSVRSVTSAGGDQYQHFRPFVTPSGLAPESLTREHVVGHFAACGVPVAVAEGEMHGWAKECERQMAQSAPGPAV